ncbi:platelet endothelial cell adhesion molecule-like isoform X2 [Sphaerodactylus townsendi]|uniref:platelet endothelial cell adhesion molecule-like isoform X2 n=1 Tax=Sphaerodactylus townsendi TaxID=933632 RepID=UPI0020261E02|nr:platelet endothelial cell adhesion molecule-like isoform X2 [Sphaerodactylus townsendi]
MYCVLLLILLHCCKLKAQENVFTLNRLVLSASPSKEVQNGESVTLNCSVETIKNSNFVLNYTFKIFKYDKLLVTITSEQEWVLYTISPARFSHFGDYQCEVNVKGKSKTSDYLPLRVKGIMKPKLTVQKTQVTEGENVLLRCEAIGENPPFYFTFYKIRPSPSTSSVHKTKPEQTENFAEVEFPVDEGDTVLFFECTVTVALVKGSETSEPSNRTTVGVAEPFSVPNITVYPQNVVEGDNIVIQCTTILSHWHEIEMILQKDKNILNNSKGGESVSYSAVATMENSGNYTCKVELGRVSKTVTVNVVVAELFSKPELHVSKEDLDEGNMLQMSCLANSSFPLNVSLMKDNTFLAHSTSYAFMANVANSGVYDCRVEIKGIVKKSDPVQIRVYSPVSKPHLYRATRFSEGAVLGRPFPLRCYSKNGTLPITYTLYRGNITVGKTEVRKDTPAEFKDNATKEHIQGEYKCEAKNGHSQKSQSSGLNITVITPVYNISLESPSRGDVEDGQDLILFCTVTSGSFPIEFNFFKENEAQSLSKVTKNKIHTAIWHKTGLTSQDTGKYFCAADNSAKAQLWSNPVIVKVVLASWKKWLIALFVMLVVLGMGGTFLWYFRKKAKAKGNSMELDGSMAATNSMGEKLTSGLNNEGELYYGSGYKDNDENHMTSKEDNKGPVTRRNDTVYTEIRKSMNDAGENRNSRIEGSPDGT